MAFHLVVLAAKTVLKNLQRAFAFKHFISFIIPVRIRQGVGRYTPMLELYTFRGRWQLATEDALYSDGEKYTPLVTAYKKIKRALPQIQNVLVLGTGLGSAVSIMSQYKLYPHFTLVEIDEVVLHWALEYLQKDNAVRLTPICMDAYLFIEQDAAKYDLLIVDVFAGRVVPSFATTGEFLKKCRQRINEGGHFIMNYIINENAEWDQLQTVINTVYPVHQITALGLNRIITAKV